MVEISRRRFASGLALSVLAAPMARAAPKPAQSVTFTDFEKLKRSDSPNSFLIAPMTFGKSIPDAPAPSFDVSAVRLAREWVSVVEEQPRTRILGVSKDFLGVEAQQESAVFHFVDFVSFLAIPLGPDQSTFALYSRSKVGYWDMGVNRSRLERWAAALAAKIATRG